jgi:hypothetical protein
VYWLMTNSGMACGCGDACDVWHAMENFVYEHEHLPFPPYTKYHRMFDRADAHLRGDAESDDGNGNLAEDRKMALYRRDDPPQYATPSEDLLKKNKRLSDPFEDPCPAKGKKAEFCDDDDDEVIDGRIFGEDGGC